MFQNGSFVFDMKCENLSLVLVHIGPTLITTLLFIWYELRQFTTRNGNGRTRFMIMYSIDQHESVLSFVAFWNHFIYAVGSGNEVYV